MATDFSFLIIEVFYMEEMRILDDAFVLASWVSCVSSNIDYAIEFLTDPLYETTYSEFLYY